MAIFGNKGQAAVEMAVVMPVLLAVAGIAINFMIFLGDSARFDRVAAEAVRTEAASPGYGKYSSVARAGDVQAKIEQSFAGSDHLSFDVSVDESGIGSSSDDDGSIGFSLLPMNETFTCTMNYRPWGFGDTFFKVRFTGIPHTRTYVIDPYRPGVVF